MRIPNRENSLLGIGCLCCATNWHQKAVCWKWGLSMAIVVALSHCKRRVQKWQTCYILLRENRQPWNNMLNHCRRKTTPLAFQQHNFGRTYTTPKGARNGNFSPGAWIYVPTISRSRVQGNASLRLLIGTCSLLTEVNNVKNLRLRSAPY